LHATATHTGQEKILKNKNTVALNEKGWAVEGT